MKLAPPTPELPVTDVPAAQIYYRDHLGFEIAWITPNDVMGAVAHGEGALFFRKTAAPIQPVTLWIYAEDLLSAWEEMQTRGAQIATPLARQPWGLTQFTLLDLDGHVLHFHCDLD